MRPKLPSNHAETIRSSLSLTGCSASTPSLLEDFLFPAAAVKANSASASRGKPTDENSAKRERHKLSVEVINSTIRILSDFVKVGSTEQTNRAKCLKPAAKGAKVSRKNDQPVTELDSADCLVLCCSLAISFLQSLEPQDGGKPLQAENTRLALASKLVQAGKLELALRELEILRGRLEDIFQRRPLSGLGPTKIKNRSNNRQTQPTGRPTQKGTSTLAIPDCDHEALRAVFRINCSDASHPAFSLAISCQITALHCIQGMKQPPLAETIAPSVRADTGPLSLIRQLCQEDPSKAISFCLSLRKVLSGIAPSSSTSSDDGALDSKAYPGPEAALQLQVAQIECLEIQKSLQPNMDAGKTRGFLDYLNPYLAAFSRRCQNNKTQQKQANYSLIRNLILQNKSSMLGLPVETLKLLSWFAMEAKAIDDAVDWTQHWLDALTVRNDPNDVALIVLCKVRLAVLQVWRWKSATSSQELNRVDFGYLQGVLREATETLFNVARGRKPDLQSLIQESSLLRRAGLMIYSIITKEDTHLSHQLSLRHLCNQILRSVISFCGKFLAMGVSGAEAAPATSLLLSTFDTTFASCWKEFDADPLELFESCDAVIFECWPAMKTLEDGGFGPTGLRFHNRVSEVYYQIHLLLRDKPEGLQQSVRALRRSIHALDGRPPEELASGQLARKWERLGCLCLSARDYDRAEDAFSSAVDAAIRSGTLNVVGERASVGESIHQMGTSAEKDISCIGRVLHGLVKIAMRKGDETAAELRFDDPSLSTATRGALLEWSFHLAMDNMGADGSVLRAISERLVDIYELEEMPIRRGRVVVDLLALAVDSPSLLDTGYVETLAEEIVEWLEREFQDLDEDQSLLEYRDYVLAMCYAGLGLSGWTKAITRPDYIKKAHEKWRAVLDSDSPLKVIDNYPRFTKRLEMMAEFFYMKGEADLRMATLEIYLLARQKEIPAINDEVVKAHISLGLECLRVGYSGKAGMLLSTAKELARRPRDSISPESSLQCDLAYTEYLARIGNISKAVEAFSAASATYKAVHDTAQSAAKYPKRLRQNRTIANAAYVASLVTFEKGELPKALYHGNLSIRLNLRAWAYIESRLIATNQSHVDTLAAGISSMSLSQQPKVMSTTHEKLNAPELWNLVPVLFTGYLHIADIYKHIGMARESLHYAEAARKIADAVDASSLQSLASIVMADVKLRSGRVSDGQESLKLVKETLTGSQASIAYELALGFMEGCHGNYAAQLEAYKRAQVGTDNLLNVMTMSQSTRLAEEKEPIGKRPEPAQQPKRQTRSRTPTRKGSVAKRPAKPTAADDKNSSTSKVSEAMAECRPLEIQKARILRLMAQAFAINHDFKTAATLLEEAGRLSTGLQDRQSQAIAESATQLQKALSLLASDPTFGVLQESTLSLPNIAALTETQGTAAVKKTNSKRTSKKTSAFVELLMQTKERLFAIYSDVVRTGSYASVGTVTSLLSGITVILAAVAGRNEDTLIHPLSASYFLELQKNITSYRERHVVDVDKRIELAKEQLEWPPLADPLLDHNPSFEFGAFQRDYIDCIPASWMAVSISFSDTGDDLYISRFQTGERQLMIRLPLNRHNSQDDYEDVYEYKEGLAELKELIEAMNKTTQSAKHQVDEQDRQKWWGERQALDDQLQEFLEKIEEEWLRGFKAIFSQHQTNKRAFAKFKLTFDKIFMKCIPSMKRKGAQKLEIDNRVLELFINLGHPDSHSLDTALTDLTYLVLDILQFHGQGVAYDEVDWDSISIGLTDALRAYHEEILQSQVHAVEHTILILDKSAQMFPWESLPCLRGRSVSRLPSLVALHNRITQMHVTQEDHTHPGHYVDRTSGGYVLNPEGDLKKTDATLGPELQKLPEGWNFVCNRPPEDKEMREIIESKDLFLYFGHGSGAQYLSSRTIRRLEKCSVACLMGCSSGALKDAGEFEPYGPPTNYLLAGCPTLVATLWDVTDKDIDAFTLGMLRRWGLFSTDNGQGEVSLVRAVAESRNDCSLKYVNGAALVVYGIPTYIKS